MSKVRWSTGIFLSSPTFELSEAFNSFSPQRFCARLHFLSQGPLPPLPRALSIFRNQQLARFPILMPLIFPSRKESRHKITLSQKCFRPHVVLTNKNTSDEAERNIGLVGAKESFDITKDGKVSKNGWRGTRGEGERVKEAKKQKGKQTKQQLGTQ